jgi:hypothetical protein
VNGSGRKLQVWMGWGGTTKLGQGGVQDGVGPVLCSCASVRFALVEI